MIDSEDELTMENFKNYLDKYQIYSVVRLVILGFAFLLMLLETLYPITDELLTNLFFLLFYSVIVIWLIIFIVSYRFKRKNNKITKKYDELYLDFKLNYLLLPDETKKIEKVLKRKMQMLLLISTIVTAIALPSIFIGLFYQINEGASLELSLFLLILVILFIFFLLSYVRSSDTYKMKVLEIYRLSEIKSKEKLIND